MVHVDLEDHRHEEYKRHAAKVKPFAGKGHTLGRLVYYLNLFNLYYETVVL